MVCACVEAHVAVSIWRVRDDLEELVPSYPVQLGTEIRCQAWWEEAPFEY